MKRENHFEKLPTLDELYYQLREIETAMNGLGTLLMASPSPPDDLPHPIDLEGIGMILVLSKRKIRRVAAHISKHALHSA